MNDASTAVGKSKTGVPCKIKTGIDNTGAAPGNLAPNEDGDDEEEDEDDDDEEETPYCDPPVGYVRLRPSQFKGLPATVFFEYPPELGLKRVDVSRLEELKSRKLGYSSYWDRVCIRNAFLRAGFKSSESNWTAMWSKHLNPLQLKDLNCLQKVNHYPASWCIGRKDRLCRTMHSMRRVHGNEYDFHPDTYVLPSERDSFHRAVRNDSDMLWILKPSASSCGRGIKVITGQQALAINTSKKGVVQKYLMDPYLIDGKKFDLRIYVLVSGVDPLRVYIHDEGLTRIATKKFSLKNIQSRFAHLTNYSINKKSSVYKAAPTGDAPDTPSVSVGGRTSGSGCSASVGSDLNAALASPSVPINSVPAGNGGKAPPKRVSSAKGGRKQAAESFRERKDKEREQQEKQKDKDKDIDDKAKANDGDDEEIMEKDETPLGDIPGEREGFKWTLAAFRRWLAEKEGQQVMESTFDRIFDLCLKTMISAESEITPHLHRSVNFRTNCYELFGCDVILDSKLNPILLEVNVSPSLMGSSPLDKKIKGTVVADMFHTVGIYPQCLSLLRKYSKPTSACATSTPGQRLAASDSGGSKTAGAKTPGSNPFTFSSLSKMMAQQEAYRREPDHSTVDISALGANESAWLLVLMAEDEMARSQSTRFHLVHPTPSAAGHYTSLYKCARFSDHLLAKWIVSGGWRGEYGKHIPLKFLTDEMAKQIAARREGRSGHRVDQRIERGGREGDAPKGRASAKADSLRSPAYSSSQSSQGSKEASHPHHPQQGTDTAQTVQPGQPPLRGQLRPRLRSAQERGTNRDRDKDRDRDRDRDRSGEGEVADEQMRGHAGRPAHPNRTTQDPNGVGAEEYDQLMQRYELRRDGHDGRIRGTANSEMDDFQHDHPTGTQSMSNSPTHKSKTYRPLDDDYSPNTSSIRSTSRPGSSDSSSRQSHTTHPQQYAQVYNGSTNVLSNASGAPAPPNTSVYANARSEFYHKVFVNAHNMGYTNQKHGDSAIQRQQQQSQWQANARSAVASAAAHALTLPQPARTNLDPYSHHGKQVPLVNRAAGHRDLSLSNTPQSMPNSSSAKVSNRHSNINIDGNGNGHANGHGNISSNLSNSSGSSSGSASSSRATSGNGIVLNPSHLPNNRELVRAQYQLAMRDAMYNKGVNGVSNGNDNGSSSSNSNEHSRSGGDREGKQRAELPDLPAVDRVQGYRERDRDRDAGAKEQQRRQQSRLIQQQLLQHQEALERGAQALTGASATLGNARPLTDDGLLQMFDSDRGKFHREMNKERDKDRNVRSYVDGMKNSNGRGSGKFTHGSDGIGGGVTSEELFRLNNGMMEVFQGVGVAETNKGDSDEEWDLGL